MSDDTPKPIARVAGIGKTMSAGGLPDGFRELANRYLELYDRSDLDEEETRELASLCDLLETVAADLQRQQDQLQRILGHDTAPGPVQVWLRENFAREITVDVLATRAEAIETSKAVRTEVRTITTADVESDAQESFAAMMRREKDDLTNGHPEAQAEIDQYDHLIALAEQGQAAPDGPERQEQAAPPRRTLVELVKQDRVSLDELLKLVFRYGTQLERRRWQLDGHAERIGVGYGEARSGIKRTLYTVAEQKEYALVYLAKLEKTALLGVRRRVEPAVQATLAELRERLNKPPDWFIGGDFDNARKYLRDWARKHFPDRLQAIDRP